MAERFIDTLREIRRGVSLDELSDEVTALVASVRETGRPGKLSYVLTVKPASKGDTNTLMILDAIKVTAPVLERATTVFYATTNNELQRNDPRQPELEGLRVLDHPSRGKDQVSNG
jgi:hypothetical protein